MQSHRQSVDWALVASLCVRSSLLPHHHFEQSERSPWSSSVLRRSTLGLDIAR